MLDSFDPFSSYDFSKSQQPETKYGIACAFLHAAGQLDAASIKPFPQFDIRLGSSKRLVAYWTTVAHRIRMEGSGILVHLFHGDALRDYTTEFMLYWLFTMPPSAKRYRELVAPGTKMLLAGEARRKALIRRLTLETFWGKNVLKYLPETWHARVVERSDAIWQQETENVVPGEGRPTHKFHIPANADEAEIAAFCHFLSRVFQRDGMMGAEGYVISNRWCNGTLPIGDPFLAYALDHAGQTWRDKVAVRTDIMQREKALQDELARRQAALTAYFICLLENDTNPNHLLWRMSSFWTEDMFTDYRDAQRYIEEGGP